MEGMAKLPDKSIDLAILDPSYGIRASKPSSKPDTTLQRNGKRLAVKTNNYKHKDWDLNPPKKKFFREVKRVSKHQIIWGVNYFNFPLTGGRIVWDKLNGGTDQYDCEIAYNSLNNRTDIVRYMWSGMMQGLRISGNIIDAKEQKGNKSLNEKRIHPTQKPVMLYQWLLRQYAKPGWKILDTGFGSGSIVIACIKEGFDFIGFENDEDHFNDAKERIDEYILSTKKCPEIQFG